ncbi:hypothetical protein MAR_001444 [Mya arenaria]|uniref:RRM domain-containing protein n=1 Tax=Mya arenaria TaxID=6604 RepID=A0ABY7FF96_MYAAR|nr:hypothetical protein MAR_001444 [Mya arenaria]
MSVKNIRHGISVAGVSWQAARGELFMYFKQFGSVKNINIHRDSYTGVSKGIARVHFRELESQFIQLAILNNPLVVIV